MSLGCGGTFTMPQTQSGVHGVTLTRPYVTLHTNARKLAQSAPGVDRSRTTKHIDLLAIDAKDGAIFHIHKNCHLKLTQAQYTHIRVYLYMYTGICSRVFIGY